jgi:hypothetical protein
MLRVMLLPFIFYLRISLSPTLALKLNQIRSLAHFKMATHVEVDLSHQPNPPIIYLNPEVTFQQPTPVNNGYSYQYSPPKSKGFVYGCGGICGATIFILLLIGILSNFF